MVYKNINAGELAVKLEVQRSNISHILNGRNKPSAAFIEKMLIVFPDLDARWLLTGQGDMVDSINEEKQFYTKEEPLVNEVAREVTINNKGNEEKKVNQDQQTTPKKGIHLQDEEVENIVLLYRDGSFSSFSNRKG